MKNENFVTVFTPTFNRADKLVRVYNSLIKQTYRNFEWLVIDDGSNDNTAAVIQEWVNEEKISIRYCYQANKGKFWSIWEGVKRANGEWFLIADSDDEFIPETIEIFLQYWEELKNENICGICGLCCWNDTKEIMGSPFPESPMISDALEITYKYKAFGEKWGILRIDKMKEFFPHEIPRDVKFMAESYIWNQMALKYKTIYVNDVLRICYRSYNEGGGLTANYMTEKYPMGIYLSENMSLICMRKYVFENAKTYVLCSVRLLYASKRAGVPLKKVMENKKWTEKVWLLALYYPSVFFACVRHRKYVRQASESVCLYEKK